MGRSIQLSSFALLFTVFAWNCQGAAYDQGAGTGKAQPISTDLLADYGLGEKSPAKGSSPIKLAAAETKLPDSCDSSANCSESGEDCDSHGCRKWIVETEAVWLSPMQEQHFGSVGFVSGAGTEEFTTANDASFTLSPRITLGVQGECWGLVGRYWRLQTGNLESSPTMITGGGPAYESCFLGETADLEVTRLFAVGEKCTQMQLSFGIRYAQFDEAAGLTVDQYDGTTYQRGSVFARHDFSGTGLTTGLRVLRPIGCNGFNLFVAGRGSILWDDDQKNYVTTRAEYLGVGGDAFSLNDAISASPTNLFIGEIQIGGQWNRALQCVPANAFLRVALEYQYWTTGASGHAEALSAAGPLDGPVVVADASSHGASHVNLFGFGIGTGLTW